MLKQVKLMYGDELIKFYSGYESIRAVTERWRQQYPEKWFIKCYMDIQVDDGNGVETKKKASKKAA